MVLRTLVVSSLAALVACSAAPTSEGEPTAQSGEALEHGTPTALPIVLVEPGPNGANPLCTGAMIDSRTVVASFGHCGMPTNLNEVRVCDTRLNGICSAITTSWHSTGGLVLTLASPIVFPSYAGISTTLTVPGTQLVCAGASTTGNTEAPFRVDPFLDEPTYWAIMPTGNADIKDPAGALCFQGQAIAGFEQKPGNLGGVFYDASGFDQALFDRECHSRCGSFNYSGRIVDCGGCPAGQICGGYSVCVAP